MENQTSETDKRALEIGKSLFTRVHRDQPSLTTTNRWIQEIMTWCLSNPKLKSRILRFVDVLPTLKTDKAITEHIRGYFPSSETRLPLALRSGSLFTQTPFTSRAVSNITKHMASEIAKQFICGETIQDATVELNKLKKKNLDYSIDVLGEAVTSDAEADKFQKTYLDLIEGFPNRTNISVKLSSLCAHFDPLSFDQTVKEVLDRLVPVIEAAKSKETFINIDMEQYYYRDLTLHIIKKLIDHPKVKGYPGLGTVFQAYLRDSEKSLKEFLDYLREKKQPMTIRLVKGAYWDSEVAKAKAANWPVPVWQEKNNTDFHFERLTELLLDNRDIVRVAIASHNIRSVAHAMAVHEKSTFSSDTIEFQLLYGMADPLKSAIKDQGYAVRVYSPYGPLIPGMAYLVRRILENTSNESFLKLDYAKETNEEVLLKPPVHTEPIASSQSIDLDKNLQSFRNEPLLDFSKSEIREIFANELNEVKESLGKEYPLLINGKRCLTKEWTKSINPANPNEVIGKVARAEWKDVEETIQVAHSAQPEWDQKSQKDRSDCMFRTADIFRRRRMQLAALEIFETGKTWVEADADVCEAIDFLEYYGRAALHLAETNSLKQVPGEINQTLYHGRGLAAIIAPWNFPLAILTGMTSAALVTGNAALIKPAETSSVIAYQLVEALLEAGVPKEIISYMPGPGREIGNRLVLNPDIDVIAFTGSNEIGLNINHKAAQTNPGQLNIKKVVAELGGKNAIIVDEDADLDEALVHVLSSAFGYQGQKCSACSRLILMDGIYDSFLDRLVQATKALKTGDPTNPETDLGPVIDFDAFQGINKMIQVGKREGRFLYQGKPDDPKSKGYFIPPTIFSDVPHDNPLAQQEIFGPVLTVFRAHNFDEAISIANNTQFALTAGLFSRNLGHIEIAKKHWAAGNLYINRKITGAFVGRQPFGGFRMSGTGSKAGGLEYLFHFIHQTTITENTFRHGFPL